MLNNTPEAQSKASIMKAIKAEDFSLNSMLLVAYRFLNNAMYKDASQLKAYLKLMSKAVHDFTTAALMISNGDFDESLTKQLAYILYIYTE